jgi:hypothetical protein
MTNMKPIKVLLILIWFIVIVSIIVGCNTSRPSINSDDVKEIEIEGRDNSWDEFTTTLVSSRDEIDQIIECINSSKKETVKARTNTKITIVYRDGTRNIFLADENYLKDKGVTYKFVCDIPDFNKIKDDNKKRGDGDKKLTN